MDFDQDAVALVLQWRKRKRLRLLESQKLARGAVSLSDIRDALVLYASAVFGKSIELRESEGLPYVSGNKIFLAPFMGLAQTLDKNAEAYQLLILHLFAINQLSPPSVGPPVPETEQLQTVTALKPAATRMLSEMFPNYQQKAQSLAAACSLPTETTPSRLAGFDPATLWGGLPRLPQFIDASHEDAATRDALPQGTERSSNARGTAKNAELDDGENLGDDVFHSFEKIETAEEYKGIQRETDGEDDLAQHADALDDLNLESVIRSSKTAKSLYKTDIDMGFEISDLTEQAASVSLEQVFTYDEWDEKKQNYKKDWCRVIHSRGQAFAQSAAPAKSHLTCLSERKIEINKLKKQLVRLASQIKVEKKLYAGRSIDIDNVIRNHCIRKSGSDGDQRFYQETKKKNRDLACLLLVDTSLSADSWVQNRRILDISLESLLVFGEATASLDDPIMVAGFNSNTRHDCRFIEWKSFEEPWQRFRAHVDSIEPAGYTRIGPAIRHATQLLEERPEKHKLLLLFTDGRPTDFDRYEGAYGLCDVRQAVREADQKGVVSFAMVLDPSAKQFLPRLFGLGNFQILPKVEQLPSALTKLYARLAKTR